MRNATHFSDELIGKVFARIDGLALGLAVGLVAGASLFLATVILVVKGGDPLGPNLSLLSQYIPGYSVSWTGSLIGGAGAFLVGLVVGWVFAFVSNLVVMTYIFGCAFWV